MFDRWRIPWKVRGDAVTAAWMVVPHADTLVMRVACQGRQQTLPLAPRDLVTQQVTLKRISGDSVLAGAADEDAVGRVHHDQIINAGVGLRCHFP